MKNVLICLVIIILAIPFALGAEVALSPVETFEGVEAEFNVEVDNYLGHDVIGSITLSSTDLEIVDVLDFIGWSSVFNPSQITWSGGSIETNTRSALFVYTAKAGLVATDEISIISGTLHYADTTTQDFSFNITVKNDTTPPVLNEVFPSNGGYARAHESSQLIRVNASDPETGIKSVVYEYSNCSNAPVQASLTCSNGYCTGNADFSAYGEDDTACFTVRITNNAEEVAVISGSLDFDETPPSVNLLFPVNNDYSNQMFRFNVLDNKASQFQCRLEIDDYEVQQLEAFAGINAFALTANISEGMHEWKIICEDGVGLEGEDEDSFIYDITPPVIVLNSPQNGTGIKDSLIDIDVNDNYEVASVDYSQSLDSSAWPDGWNSLTVTAVDSAGNTAVASFMFYVDRQAPVIEIISPDNGAVIDYHGSFVVRVTDDFDEAIECAVSTTVAGPVVRDVDSGEESAINVMLPLGEFSWYVFCSDDFGNSARSEQRSAAADDLTGPDILVQDIDYVARGTDLEIQATVTDISGVRQVYADFEGTVSNLVSQGSDVYAGHIAVPADKAVGDYSVTVFAVDNKDLSNNAVEEFSIVENYEITVNLPSSVAPHESVSVAGRVTKDDSSAVAGIVTITYPGGMADAVLDENTGFSYAFTAPDSDGSYQVVVAYETENLVYSVTASFSVVSPAQLSGSGSSGIPFDYQGLYSGIKPEEAGQPEQPSGEASASELILPEEPAPAAEIPEEEPRVPAITGRATGLFDLLGKNIKWWVLVLTAIGLVAGSIYAFRRIKKKDKGTIEWGPKFR